MGWGKGGHLSKNWNDVKEASAKLEHQIDQHLRGQVNRQQVRDASEYLDFVLRSLPTDFKFPTNKAWKAWYRLARYVKEYLAGAADFRSLERSWDTWMGSRPVEPHVQG